MQPKYSLRLTMTIPATQAHISYQPATPRTDSDNVRRLAAQAAVEPILKRWRHRCSPGLIDSNGKVRNVFTNLERDTEDPVSRVIRDINQVPEAVAELEAAHQARQRLTALTRDLVAMPVHDARALQTTSLSTTGFQLARHVSAVQNWHDGAAVADVYYDEINSLVKQVTGATHTFSNNHLLRQSEPDQGGNGPLARLMSQSRGPVLTAHNDFAESFGEGIIRTLEAQGVPHTQTFGLTDAMLRAGVTAEQLRASRMLVVNTWRYVGQQPLQRFPLALADRRTVSRSCLRRTLIGARPAGAPRGGIDIYSACHEPAHRWYYYPQMTRDEVLLWKGYDSAEVPIRPTLHTAFANPHAPAHAEERVSMEVRVLCLLPV